MFDDLDPIAQAVTVLTLRSHTIEPGDDFESWRVDGDEPITAGDLLVLAIVLGLNGGVGRLQ